MAQSASFFTSIRNSLLTFSIKPQNALGQKNVFLTLEWLVHFEKWMCEGWKCCWAKKQIKI